MELTLEKVQEQQAQQARSQAYSDMGLEYNARALCPPANDKELQSILAREKELRRDQKVPADIKKEQAHLEAIEKKIDKLVYHTVITEDVIREIGMLTILWHHHLERIELGSKNPLANELLNIFQAH